MSALFDFSSFLTVVLLFICSCTYYKLINPGGLTQTTGWVVLLLSMALFVPAAYCMYIWSREKSEAQTVLSLALHAAGGLTGHHLHAMMLSCC
jgi:hypothetical protein